MLLPGQTNTLERWLFTPVRWSVQTPSPIADLGVGFRPRHCRQINDVVGVLWKMAAKYFEHALANQLLRFYAFQALHCRFSH